MNEEDTTAVVDHPVDSLLLEKVLGNQLGESEAIELARSAPETMAFTILALQQRIAEGVQASGSNSRLDPTGFTLGSMGARLPI